MALPPRFTVELRVGRLLEARIFSLKTAEDVVEYGAAIAAGVAKAPATVMPILCADHRPVRVYPQPAADRLTEMFKRNNTRLAYAALVIDPANATLLLQLERIVREANYERRKVFRDAPSALAQLGTVLDSAERARAAAFLTEWV